MSICSLLSPLHTLWNLSHSPGEVYSIGVCTPGLSGHWTAGCGAFESVELAVAVIVAAVKAVGIDGLPRARELMGLSFAVTTSGHVVEVRERESLPKRGKGQCSRVKTIACRGHPQRLCDHRKRRPNIDWGKKLKVLNAIQRNRESGNAGVEEVAPERTWSQISLVVTSLHAPGLSGLSGP